MKFNKIFPLVIVFTYLLTLRCQKDNEIISEIKKGTFISKITVNKVLWEEFIYDQYNRLIRRNQYLYDDENYYIYKYNLNNKIVRIERKSSSVGYPIFYYYTYKYDDKGSLIKKEITTDYGNENIKKSYLTYDYNSNDQIIEEKSYSSEDVLRSYWTFLYDQKRNIVKSEYYRIEDVNKPILMTTYSQEFDYQNNPYNNLNFPDPNIFHTSKNNVIKWTYISHKTKYSEEYEVVYETRYEYDSKGLPIKGIQTCSEYIESTITEYDYIEK